MLRRHNLLVVAFFFLLLGAYTVFLHQKLAESQSQPLQLNTHSQSQDALLKKEYERTTSNRVSQEAGDKFVKQTEQLANEVANLAGALHKQDGDLLHHHAEQVTTPVAQLKRQAAATRLRLAQDLYAAGAAQHSMRHHEHGNRRHSTSATMLPATQSAEERRLQQLKSPTERQQAVVRAMKHAWDGYVEFAWGKDELQPMFKRGKDSFGGLGATIVDSLDTLWLMGLKEDYRKARDWVATELTFARDHDSSVFETTIRVIGGMLAAHDLTQDTMYVKRCQELATILMHAFKTPTGIPWGTINLQTLRTSNPSWTSYSSTLSEFGTELLELMKLSDVSKDETYVRAGTKVLQLLHDKYTDKGLLPVFVSPQDGSLQSSHITLGALGDSYYEYLLKVWILAGKGPEAEMYRAMWEKAMDEMMDRLIFKSKGGLMFIAELKGSRVEDKMDHLACFIPGMLALGVHHKAVTGGKADRYMQLAKDMTYTCFQMYHRQPTGISPEYVTFNGVDDMQSGAAHNLLRPEAVESIFVLWRVTGDKQYREWGWEIFQAFEKYCKASIGYTGLKDVRIVPPRRDDTMQSFFLAETLKYLYLLFSPSDVVSLDEFVLNTEAHPLRVLKKSAVVK